jgi:hypothetical protein
MRLLAAVRSGHLGGVVEPDPDVLCHLGAVNAQAILGPPQQWWRLLTASPIAAADRGRPGAAGSAHGGAGRGRGRRVHPSPLPEPPCLLV